MEIKEKLSSTEGYKLIKEFRPVYFYSFAAAVLLFFLLATAVILLTFSSYRDYLVRESLDNYGYEFEPKQREKREFFLLEQFYWVDKKKKIVHLPFHIAGPLVIKEYGEKRKKLIEKERKRKKKK